MKIFHKLILAFLVVALLVWGIGNLAINISEQELKKSLINESQHYAKVLLDQIDRDLYSKMIIFHDFTLNRNLHEALRKSNRNFESMADMQSYITLQDNKWTSREDKENNSLMKELIENSISAELRQKSAFYNDENGYTVFGEVFITNRYGANIAQTGRTTDYRQDDEEWWQKTMQNGFYLRDIKYDESAGLYSIALGIRINDRGGDFIGTIKVVINIESAINMLRQVELSGMHKEHRHMAFHLLTGDGRLIYSSRSTEVDILGDFLSELPVTEDLFANHKEVRLGAEEQPHASTLIFTHADSKGYRSYPGLGWILLIEHRQDELLAPIQKMRKFITSISLSVTFLGILIGFIVSASIMKNIGRLIDATKKIGTGELNHRINLKSKDETAQLAEAFNSMTENLNNVTTSRNRLNWEIAERMLVEESLRQRQEELTIKHDELNLLFKKIETINKETQKVMDSVGDMIILADDEHRIQRVNRAVQEFIGLPYDKIIGRHWDELVDGEHLVAKTLHTDSTELLHKPSGKWFSLKAYTCEDRDLELSGTIVTLHEFTEVRAIREELEESNRTIESDRMKLQNALDRITILMQDVINNSERIAKVDNPNLKKCYEVKNCENSHCACYGKDGLRCWQAEETYCEGTKQDSFTHKFSTCSSCEVYREATPDPVSRIGELFNNMMHVLQMNIDKRFKAEKEIKESEERFRSLAETANDAIISIDRSGTSTFWNPGAERIFGFSEGEMLGKPITLIMPENCRKSHEGKFEHISSSGTGISAKTLETMGMKKDGTTIPVEISLSSWTSKNEMFYTAIIRDITLHKELEYSLIKEKEESEKTHEELEKAYTELKATQSQILQKEKMASIGQLAAGVAHEINNPMGFISSNLGTLRKYTEKLNDYISELTTVAMQQASNGSAQKLHEKRKKLKIDYVLEDLGPIISESLEGTERVKTIVQNLKSFSRVDEAEYKHADINECIESTMNIVWNELKYKATVKREFGELPLTRCYPQQLNQVFMNILVNAVHSIEKQGVISIKTWNGDGNVNISISDTGVGIPEERLTKIFEPFFTTKEVGKGTGLGLSITYDIVKKHNGDISVESRPGEGTTFTISIPVVEGK